MPRCGAEQAGLDPLGMPDDAGCQQAHGIGRDPYGIPVADPPARQHEQAALMGSGGQLRYALIISRVAFYPQRTAIGATVDPVAPCIFSGCMMNANS